MVNGTVLGHYGVTKGTYFKSETAPTINHHVSLRSSQAGTFLYIDGTKYTVGSSFVKVGSILYNTNRYAGQAQFDNILLNCRVENNYATRMLFEETTSVQPSVRQAVPVAYFTLEGRRVQRPESGKVYIVKLSDGTAKKVRL